MDREFDRIRATQGVRRSLTNRVTYKYISGFDVALKFSSGQLQGLSVSRYLNRILAYQRTSCILEKQRVWDYDSGNKPHLHRWLQERRMLLLKVPVIYLALSLIVS